MSELDDKLPIGAEEVAEAKRQHYCRGEKEACEVCGGIGEIEYEEDYEPDYDDYYE